MSDKYLKRPIENQPQRKTFSIIPLEDRLDLERAHYNLKGHTPTKEGAREALRRLEEIYVEQGGGSNIVDHPTTNWEDTINASRNIRNTVPTEKSKLSPKLGKVPDAMLKAFQKKTGYLFRALRGGSGVGLLFDPLVQEGMKMKEDFDLRAMIVSAYALKNPRGAWDNKGELIDFLLDNKNVLQNLKNTDQQAYEAALYGYITDWEKLNQYDMLPEQLEALHQQDLWDYLGSPSQLSSHPNLQGPSVIMDLDWGLPKFVAHGSKGESPITEFTQQRKQWNDGPGQEFGAGFFGTSGQALDITSRLRSEFDPVSGERTEKEGYVLPGVKGVRNEVARAKAREAQGATSTTGQGGIQREGRSAEGTKPFAGVVRGKQIDPKYYMGVLDIKNPMIVYGDVGWWTPSNILAYMANDQEFRPDEMFEDDFVGVNAFLGERENLLAKANSLFTYSSQKSDPSGKGPDFSVLNDKYKIPDSQQSEYGSGTVLEMLLEYAQVHAKKDGQTLLRSELKGKEEPELSEEDLFYLQQAGGSDDLDLDAIADQILDENKDAEEERFNYYMNLALKDFFLNDLGYDGIQFFNSVEDKQQGDWSYIILDGSQFKNIMQRKPTGTGYSKDDKRHMSKRNTDRFKKVA